MSPTVTILLSDKRSGSTLTERELCKHSAINHVIYSPHTYNETHYWLKAACLLSTSTAGFYGGVPPNSYGSKRAVRKSLVHFLKRNSPDFVVPETDEALVFNGWNALCKSFTNPIFFEKSPQHPHHWAALELLLEWIRTTEYQVKVIGLVRNPMSVMYSALQLFQTDPQSRQFGWAHAYNNIFRFGNLLNDDQFYFIRYETVVENPESEFSKLCDFIGIEHERPVGRSVHSDSLNKWRNDLSFIFQLDETVSELAAKMGYSAQDLYNPPKPKPALTIRIRDTLALGLKRKKQRVYNFIKRLMIRSGLSD